MVDEKENKESSTGDAGERSKPETTPVIEHAREEREKLDAANEKREKILDREEALAAKKELGGGSEAGQLPVEKPEETPKEYRDRIEKEISEGKHDD